MTNPVWEESALTCPSWKEPALTGPVSDSPEVTGRATVTSKRVDQGRYLGKAPSRWNYMMTFALSDGEEIELYVTQDIFSTLQVGHTGQLTWQGKRFYHFDSDN